MRAALWDIEVEQNSDFSQTLTWTDEAEAPLNITGYTAKMQVKSTYTSAVVVLELSTANGRIVLGGVAGTIALSCTADVTATLTPGNYVFDLILIPGGVSKIRLAKGQCVISPAVTV